MPKTRNTWAEQHAESSFIVCSSSSIEVVASTGTTTGLDFEGKTTTTYIYIDVYWESEGTNSTTSFSFLQTLVRLWSSQSISDHSSDWRPFIFYPFLPCKSYLSKYLLKHTLDILRLKIERTFKVVRPKLAAAGRFFVAPKCS